MLSLKRYSKEKKMISFQPLQTNEVQLTPIKSCITEFPREIEVPVEVEVFVPVEDKLKVSKLQRKILQQRIIIRNLQEDQQRKVEQPKDFMREFLGIVLFLQIVILTLIFIGV